jgi:hypothetical protein
MLLGDLVPTTPSTTAKPKTEVIIQTRPQLIVGSGPLYFGLVNVELVSILYLNVGVAVWIRSNIVWISGSGTRRRYLDAWVGPSSCAI